jgi:ElaB/YqjD/DUF883 family membrane-anchored ribosome-binding protein
MTDIIERLRGYARDDHERGCNGRYYDCSCGYDKKRDPLLIEAADEIERLREELDTWKSVFPDIAPDRVLPDRSLLEAENERLRAALEAVDEALNDAAQDDCESGVKWLNERAAEGYLKEYPHTSAAISKVIGLTRTALEKSRE